MVCFAFLLYGCGYSQELNNRTFVTGIFIDQSKAPNSVEVTISSLLPNRLSSTIQSTSSQGVSYSSVTKSAKSIPEAIDRIQVDLTRSLSWGHTKVIVVGKKYAEDTGLSPLFDWISREPSFFIKTPIFVAPEKAKDIVHLSTVYENTPSEVLGHLARLNLTFTSTIRDFLIGTIQNQGTAATYLSLGKVPLVSEEKKLGQWAGIQGAALFSSNKMVGTINNTQSKLFAWVNNRLQEKITSPVLIVPIGKENEFINVGLRKFKSSVRPIWKKNKIHYHFDLSAQAEIISGDIGYQDLKKPDFSRIENQIKEKLSNELRSALKKSQSVQADVLQLGNRLETYHPEKWKLLEPKWKSLYQHHVDFSIDINIHLKRTGEMSRPLWKAE